MSESPVFVVVGHPNKGKSSIVSTLSQDDSVRVAPEPGTTIAARHFPLRVDGQTLYTLVDTPGFQRARRALEWMREHETTAAEHAAVVRAFVEAHRDGDRFPDEVELLTPIVEGGGILYVVDGSKPYGPEYEPEMEILRWTGQPSMALINPIGNADHVAPWEAALGQYFRIVRVLDALRADFDRRLELLRAFGQMREQWRDPMQRAVEVLDADRRHRRRRAAQAIADLLVDTLTLSVGRNLTEREDPESHKPALERKYKDRLRDLEREARRDVERAYDHHRLQREETVEALETDLFSQESYHLFGQPRWRMAAIGAGGGAIAGGVIDASLAGLSFGVFTGLGAAAGAALGWQAAEWSSSFQVFTLPGMEKVGLAGRRVECGPTENRQFPHVVLARALLHHQLVAGRTHADRGVLDLRDAERGALNPMGTEEARRLERPFERIRRASGRGDRLAAERARLRDQVEDLLGEGGPTPGD